MACKWFDYLGKTWRDSGLWKRKLDLFFKRLNLCDSVCVPDVCGGETETGRLDQGHEWEPERRFQVEPREEAHRWPVHQLSG